MNNNLIEIKDLSVNFPIKSGYLGRKTGELRAVNRVSFNIKKGQTLGLVGESGCGKTTLGKSILRLIEPSNGNIRFKSTLINDLKNSEMRKIRKKMQIIFQDPYSSLNPRMNIRSILSEPLKIHNLFNQNKQQRNNRIYQLLDYVQISKSALNKYPHEFSGGQRQRICIARALAVEPEFIVCDEAVSSLDVSVQAQILNILMDLQKELNLTYLFISHNLEIIQFISHEVAVMYFGNIIEKASASEIYDNPKHPYTKALLSSILNTNFNKDRIILKGDIPNAVNPPNGCHFHPKCWKATDICKEIYPDESVLDDGHIFRCYHPL
ncbi:MAG: ABC transporter ATP-binding protein [Bacteroidetes bacterium]|nr:ABC transporter ATP-binding protein [Bacteroidota bacterium]